MSSSICFKATVARSVSVALLAMLGLALATPAFAANLGNAIPVVGTVADLIYDPARNLVYFANSTRSEIGVYSVDTNRVVGTIQTGLQPASLALSPDYSTLYTANLAALSVSAINLDAQRRVADYAVGSRPDAIAVGNDGKVVILGTSGLLRLDTASGRVSPVPISPPATAPAGIAPINPAATPPGFLAGLVTAASGNLIIGLSTNRLFVYEVASGTVLRSRNVTGLRAILSASTDGSRFMAGPFLFDTQTLTILGRAGTVAANLTGGSAFSVDGNAVYATFSTQTSINPLNTNQPNNPGGAAIPGAIPGLATGAVTPAMLQVLRSSSLTQQMGLRLPEAVTSRMIASPDGQYLFANSTSGLLIIPIGRLSTLPVLDVSTSNVVLSVDACNRTTVTTSVQIRNLGGGRMTFGAVLNNQNAPVILNQRTGVAPANLTISFDPRRVTARGTLQFSIVLVSPEAVNIEPAILVNLNYRDVSDRGAIVPFTGVAVDQLVDTPRRRVYIANYSQDQIEVFSLASQAFLQPIRVGNRPLSMALVNSTTMVVANSGAESISVVDLDALQEVDQIPMGPVPLNAAPLFPRSIAASSNAILFSAVPLPPAGVNPGNGSIWQLSLLTRSLYPRLDLGTGIANTVQGRNTLVAPADGSSILLAEANGTIRLYDPLVDTFVLTRPGAVTGWRGSATAAPDGSYYVVDNSVFNSVLSFQGSIAPAAAVAPGIPGFPGQPGQPGGPGGAANQAALAFGVTITGGAAVRVTAATPALPVQSLQRYSFATLQADQQITLPEAVLDISPAQVQTPNGTRQWPPRVTALELGVNNQTAILPRGMVTDGANAYILSYSGLSVVSLAPAAGRAPAFTAGGVINSASRTNSLSPGSLITILGTNLADPATASGTPLPRSLGGVCVTANEAAIPLISTAPNQIEAQLPPDLGTGRITLMVRSTRLGLTSPGVLVGVSPTSPGVIRVDVDGVSRAALYHAVDGALVTPDYPADRDEYLVLYATGLGPVSPPAQAGVAAPDDVVSTATQRVHVEIGGEEYPVLWAGLAPGMIGVYQINLYVPGSRTQGDGLPVIVTAGGASSASSNAPVAVVR